MRLADATTARYEHQRQTALAGLSPEEHAANALLDAAWQTDPSRARTALHVAMYAERMGFAMPQALPGRRLWMLGLLSVLAANAADEYPIFADYRTDERSAEILEVARAFEAAVQDFEREGTGSPADTLRFMLREPQLFSNRAVLALRRALRGLDAPGENREELPSRAV